MHPTFRPSTTQDVPQLLLMMERFYLIDQYAFHRQLTEENLHTFIQQPALGRLWCIIAADTVVGYMALTFGFSFEFGGRNAFLDELYVEEAYRGRGFGKAAIQYALQQAPLLAVKAIHLEVEKRNSAAQHLYRQAGFKDHDRYLMTYKTPATSD